VARWPFFGALAKLQRTIFVDRMARHRTHDQRSEITRRLERGRSLILFPEGTSDNGARVLPFKSALLSAAEEPVRGRMPLVQPVSIAYTRLDGAPMGRALRPFFAWYGDMSLVPHLWQALGLGTVTVEVEFHAPVTAAEFPSRKALADYCRRRVAAGIALAISGRAPEVTEIPVEMEPTDASAAAGRP
jgi:1-acyl-sn-glycerol-3-phosphate acyltransferase